MQMCVYIHKPYYWLLHCCVLQYSALPWLLQMDRHYQIEWEHLYSFNCFGSIDSLQLFGRVFHYSINGLIGALCVGLSLYSHNSISVCVGIHLIRGETKHAWMSWTSLKGLQNCPFLCFACAAAFFREKRSFFWGFYPYYSRALMYCISALLF